MILNSCFLQKMNDILKFRYHYNRFQYRVNWANWSHDRTWYYVNNEKFDNVRDVVNDYHRTYFVVANSKTFKSMIVVSFVVDEQNFSTNRRRFRKKNRYVDFNRNHIRLAFNVTNSMYIHFDSRSFCFKILFRFSIFLLRFCVIYSQNLRRMKNWIVSKTFSKIVVRFYEILKW